MKNTKVYLMRTENVKDPRTFALWKEFLPKECWEKTVRPLKEEDRKTELAATSSTIGDNIWHGPHQTAQKSTRTFPSACNTSCSKLLSVTFTIAIFPLPFDKYFWLKISEYTLSDISIHL